jgi:hypothetical protein
MVVPSVLFIADPLKGEEGRGEANLDKVKSFKVNRLAIRVRDF